MKSQIDRRLAALESEAKSREYRACITSSPYTPDEAYAQMTAPDTHPTPSTDTRSPMEQYMAILNGPTR